MQNFRKITDLCTVICRKKERKGKEKENPEFNKEKPKDVNM